jgi:hypothetical protein
MYYEEQESRPKFERIPVVCKCQGDYKVLAFVSGNSIAELEHKMKENTKVRMNGLVWLQNVSEKAYNSNKF